MVYFVVMIKIFLLNLKMVIKPSEITIKIKESLLLLTAIITNKEILEIKNKGEFILVYNKDKNPITAQEIKQKDIEESPSSQYIKQYIL